MFDNNRIFEVGVKHHLEAAPCPSCRGTGKEDVHGCLNCGGTGRLWLAREVSLADRGVWQLEAWATRSGERR